MRLKDARIIRGETCETLASKIGVTKQAVSRYEKGEMIPASDVIDKISQSLKVSKNYLTKVDMVKPDELNMIFYRSCKIKKKEEDLVRAYAKWCYEIVVAMKECEIDTAWIPPLFKSDMNIEEKAIILRDKWKLEEVPIEDILRVIEDNGIHVFVLDLMTNDIDAYSQIICGIPIIIINKQKGTAVRRRFSLAHELGHIILHASIKQEMIKDPQERQRIENEANQFASNFLMPRRGFYRDIARSDLQSLSKLKSKWKVSIYAIIKRCEELMVFGESLEDNKTRFISIQKQLIRNGWKKKEPYDDEIPYEEPRRMAEIMRGFKVQNRILEFFFDLVCFPVENLLSMCNVADLYGQKSENLYSNSYETDDIENVQQSFLLSSD